MCESLTLNSLNSLLPCHPYTIALLTSQLCKHTLQLIQLLRHLSLMERRICWTWRRRAPVSVASRPCRRKTSPSPSSFPTGRRCRRSSESDRFDFFDSVVLLYRRNPPLPPPPHPSNSEKEKKSIVMNFLRPALFSLSSLLSFLFSLFLDFVLFAASLFSFLVFI